MTKYFSQDTPLAGLERMMMSVPGFQKRGGGMMVLCRFHYKKEDVDCTYCRSYMRHTCQESVCPYIPERLEAGTIGYQELAERCLRMAGHQKLWKRASSLSKGKTLPLALEPAHRHRLSEWPEAGTASICPQKLAAVYLLSSRIGLWRRVLPHISHGRIDFSSVSLRGIDPRDYPVYRAAKGLYCGKLLIKRGVYTHGKSYRGNVSGCDPRYSFHWTGSSDRLYVFEAPIDLLSFLTLYPQDWQKHSYVALCGTSEHAMLWMLEQNPQIRKVALCLDHDEAGIEASGQHEDTLRERGIAAAPLRSQYKDWNADLKALHGLPAEPAEEHPQLLAADPICQRIGAAVSSGVAKPEQAEQKLPILLQDYKNHLHQGRFDRAMDAMELAAAMALSSALREFRQMGKVVSPQQGAERLRQSIQPHHNRGSLKNRADEIAMELQRILAQKASAGICGRESKESLAYRWLELAASCAKVPIRYEADQIKQRQKEEQAQRGAGPVME